MSIELGLDKSPLIVIGPCVPNLRITRPIRYSKGGRLAQATGLWYGTSQSFVLFLVRVRLLLGRVVLESDPHTAYERSGPRLDGECFVPHSASDAGCAL